MDNDSSSQLDARAEMKAYEEVVQVLHEYLSDQVAPLMLFNEGEALLHMPSPVLSNAIKQWVARQYRSGKNVPVSDYLYHVARKIHQIGDLQIFPEEAFRPFQAQLTTTLVGLCPEADRQRLIADLEQLSTGQSLETAPVHVEYRGAAGRPAERGIPDHRPAGPAPVEHGVAGESTAKAMSVEQAQRLELLLRRLESAAPPARTGEKNGAGSGAAADPIVAEAVLSAADAANSTRQFEELLARFKIPELPSSPAELLAILARRLPDWAPPAGGEGMEGARPRAVEAMRKVVATADSPMEAGLRYRKLVETAAEELNQGFLGRAVTLLDLAQRMVDKKEIDESSAARLREQGQELLDFERLGTFASAGETHSLLRRVMGFFRDLTPAALLARLETEEDRERRRTTLSLLHVHGPATRAEVLKRLERSIKEGGALSWYYERNLVLLLRDIPPVDEEDLNRQIDVLVWLAQPGGPLSSVRGALTALGSVSAERSESALTAIVGDLERALAGDLELPYSRDETEELLDRAVGALAAAPSRDARRKVVRHALDRKRASIRSVARLAPLGQLDLRDDPQLVQYLLELLLEELPVKVFGRAVLTSRRSATISAIVTAVAGTDVPEVRHALSEVARRFPGQGFATEAQRILANLGRPEGPKTEKAATMVGDLALLSLPNLLQNLADAHLSGTLTLFDGEGATSASVVFSDGMMAKASAGHLEGKTAFFQILQTSDASRFLFTQSDAPEPPVPEATLQPVLPLLLEGMRRLDELRCAEAVVPPDASLQATSKQPSQVPDETDEDFVQAVWKAASSGRPAAACEAELPADSYRIRRMYEHWLQEGALRLRDE